MFERFTKEARAAVMGAQRIALDIGTGRIDTRHLLVALAESEGSARVALDASGIGAGALADAVRRDLASDGIDAEALASLGIDLDTVRRQAEHTFGPNALETAGSSGKRHIPFDRDAKKALELALREAVRLSRRSIDGGMILLGILRSDNPARRLIGESGGDPCAIRNAVESAHAA